MKAKEALTVVCFKWFDPRGRWNADFVYGAGHVNRLQRMLARNLKMPHRLVCVTDDPAGIECETVEINRELLALGQRFAKLSLFDPEMQRRLGGRRLLSLDLDCVIIDALDPLLRIPDDFCIWSDTSRSTPYNSSMILLDAGARPEVWTRFDPRRSPQTVARSGYIGSDQAWIGIVLGRGERTWTADHGVLSFKRHCMATRDLPPVARIVFFHGRVDPSVAELQRRHPWIPEHWQ